VTRLPILSRNSLKNSSHPGPIVSGYACRKEVSRKMRQTRRRFLDQSGRLAAGLTLSPGILRASASVNLARETYPVTGRTYYVDTAGNNQNSGTSAGEPWKDFAAINQHTFSPGDSLLLKRGCVWHEELRINGAGSAQQFITLAAYGDGARPKIQRDRKPNGRCLRLNNSSYLKVSNLEVCDGGAGIVLFYNHSYQNRSVYLDDIVAHDFQKVEDPEDGGRITWSYGIGVTGVEDTPNNQTCVLSDLRITNTEVYRTGAGIALDWGNHRCMDGTVALRNKFSDVYMEHLNLHDNTVDGNSFVSLFISSVTRCTVKNSTIERGARYAPTGTSALQLMYTKDVSLINVTINDTPFNPCPDNTALDFECDNEDVMVDGCTFKNNAGPAIEVLATPGYANATTRNFVIRNCTFINNNSSHKVGNHQIEVANWVQGNRPTGKIYNNKYSNAPNAAFFGGDGNCTGIELGQNTNIGKPEPGPTVLQSWKFNSDGNAVGWQNGPYSAGISQLRVSSGSLNGIVNGIDPGIVSADRLGVAITPGTFVRIKMKNATNAAFGQIYFITDADDGWNEEKHRDFWLYPEAAGFNTYDVDMFYVTKWADVLRRLRIDPEQGASTGSFSIEMIQILRR
jgi:hypothetical protein